MYHRQSPPADLLDMNSIYSLAPYQGGSSSMLSPSVTAQQPITPLSRYNQVHFEFPPDLAAPAGFPQSIEESESEKENQQMVPYYAPAPSTPKHLNPLSPPHIHLNYQKADMHTLATRSTLSTTSTATSRELVPLSTNNNTKLLIPDVNPKIGKYKQKRKNVRAAATAGGMVVGGLTLGPAGIVVGAGVGVATNKFFKLKEKKAQRKHEQKCFQQAASRSMVARQQGALC
jgi:hypothetical protein